MTTTPIHHQPRPQTAPLQVLIVDDAGSTRRFLRAVLSHVSALQVVGEAGTGRDAIESASQLQPDIVLLDLSLPDADGASLLPILLRASPDTRIVVLSNNAKVAGPDLVTAGAAGFIEKGLAPRILLNQLSKVLATPLLSRLPLPEL